jgi:hypothetical protein
MGIEFEAVDPRLPEDLGERLRRDVVASGRWVEVGRNPGAAFSVRRVDQPPRREWPADVDVFFEHGSLRVVFHSATGRDRERFVEVVRDCLRSVGSDGHLAEV